MNKFLRVFLACLTLFAVANATVKTKTGPTINWQPAADVSVFDVCTRNTGSSYDTLAAQNDINYYGPYPLSGANEGQAAALQIQGDAITGTTPVMSVDYMLMGGVVIGDSCGAWVSACTLGTAGVSKSISLSGTAAKTVLIRVNNYDATASQIPGLLRLIVRKNVTFMKQ